VQFCLPLAHQYRKKTTRKPPQWVENCVFHRMVPFLLSERCGMRGVPKRLRALRNSKRGFLFCGFLAARSAIFGGSAQLLAGDASLPHTQRRHRGVPSSSSLSSAAPVPLLWCCAWGSSHWACPPCSALAGQAMRGATGLGRAREGRGRACLRCSLVPFTPLLPPPLPCLTEPRPSSCGSLLCALLLGSSCC
jgi:hypothetical protein